MDYERERNRPPVDAERRRSEENEGRESEGATTHYPDPLLGGCWGRGYRRGFGRWGVGWGLQNFGGGPQGYGWGGGGQGGHGEIYYGSRFGGGYGGSPEITEPGHAGRGPKGYTRSDERIREDVSEELWANPWIDASEMTVSVAKGEVILEGTVPDRRTKRLAEDAAERIPGVRDIHNRLRVAQQGASDSPFESGSVSVVRRS